MGSRKKKKFINYDEDSICEYDFHLIEKGTTPKEIKERLFNIIDGERRKRTQILRLIVGKGINSKYGPVVKPAIEDGLLELIHIRKIKKFNLEKLNNGDINEGAFIVNIF